MSIGAMVEIHRRRVLNLILVTSVLWIIQYTSQRINRRTYAIFFFIKHEGGYGMTHVGTMASLTMDTNSGAAPTELILGAGNGASGHRHDRVKEVMMRRRG